jgi:hypothetical protein
MTKKTINNTFSLLSEYYHLEFKILSELDHSHMTFLNYKDVDLSSYQYALCLYYGQDQLIGIVYFTNENSIDYNERFNFYLQKLKAINMHSIAVLFSYIVCCDAFESKNPYEYENNYPSEFCMHLLQSTNGYVLYRYQLLKLLKASQPYATDLDFNQTIKSFNLKKHSVYNDLKDMILPDGYKLYDILQNYTPLGSNNNTFGIVVEPDYKTSYAFYKSISNNFNV